MAIQPLVLYGRLVTMEETMPVIDEGALYIGADELIHAVQERGEAPPAGFDSAPRAETKGCNPGLIDLHSHVVYNILPLWSPPGTTEPLTDRADWPNHGDYEGSVSDPANAMGALAGKAHLKYCEVKAVVGGTTAIQGSAKMAYPYGGWLVRNVEYETFKAKKKTVYQSALPLKDADESRFHMSATFSSPSRFFDPEGDQSEPRQIRIPLSLAAATSVVWRYSHTSPTRR